MTCPNGDHLHEYSKSSGCKNHKQCPLMKNPWDEHKTTAECKMYVHPGVHFNKNNGMWMTKNSLIEYTRKYGKVNRRNAIIVWIYLTVYINSFIAQKKLIF